MYLLDRISDYVDHYAKVTPQSTAYVFQDRVCTYRELKTQVDRFAKALIQCGVRLGDRIVVCTTPRPEGYVSFLAAARVGAIWVGLNPKCTLSEFEYPVRHCSPALILSISNWEGRDYTADMKALVGLTESAHSVVPLEGTLAGSDAEGAFLNAGDAVPDAVLLERARSVTRESPCLLVYTSGSTGVPKGVLLSHYSLVYGFRMQAEMLQLESPKWLCNLPMNHIGGLGDACCTPLVCGGSTLFMERFDAKAILRAIGKGQVSALLQVATQWQEIKDHEDFATTDFAHLEQMMWGGSAMPKPLQKAYRDRGVKQTILYGMTEVPGNISMSLPGAPPEVLENTAGRPMPGLDVRIQRDDGTDAPINEQGEIVVKHGSVMLCYFRNEEATRAVVDERGYFHTGDIGWIRDDGHLLIVGRKRDMYKSGGYNVSPREVELCFEAHPLVKVAAVIGVPDSKYQEVGYAFVVPKQEGGIGRGELEEWCRQRLANYKIPKQIEVRSSLPLLGIGKIDKTRLREEAAGRLREQPIPPISGNG